MVEKMSLWSLVWNASLVVQLVMLILLLASFISWVMILQRRSFLRRATRNVRRFEEKFWSGVDLSHLFREVNANPDHDSALENLFRAGLKEFTRLRGQCRSR